ncbi:MAG: glycoside hydrolase family 113 [Aureispira sp.]
MLFLLRTVVLFFCLIILTACPKKEADVKEIPRTTSSSEAPKKLMVCDDMVETGLLVDKMNGISLVAPPNAFKTDPMADLQALGASWVAVLPYAYFKKDQPSINAFSKHSWWGERPEGIATSTKYAHENGLKVMLKPQLWTHDQWIGNLKFETEENWTAFEQNYEKFILRWAVIGDSLGVELLCVGTELCKVVKERPQFWRQLLPKIRQVYKGKLTYAPNWDSYQDVSFWDDLDYIGVDAYFPLLEADTPSVCALKEAWKPYVQKLEALAKQWNKPMLFTEYGYLSLDRCTYNSWELEKNRGSVNINEQAQANALEALLETFGKKTWWAGGFIWKWYPTYNASMGEGKHARDYTPQGKKAQVVLHQLFRKP